MARDCSRDLRIRGLGDAAFVLIQDSFWSRNGLLKWGYEMPRAQRVPWLGPEGATSDRGGEGLVIPAWGHSCLFILCKVCIYGPILSLSVCPPKGDWGVVSLNFTHPAPLLLRCSLALRTRKDMKWNCHSQYGVVSSSLASLKHPSTVYSHPCGSQWATVSPLP